MPDLISHKHSVSLEINEVYFHVQNVMVFVPIPGMHMNYLPNTQNSS